MIAALQYVYWEQRLLLLALGLALLGLTFELIRRRRLREEYAVLWVCTGLFIVAFAAVPGALFAASAWLRLDHSVLLTFVCVLFLASILLHYSVRLSRHSENEKRLTQEMALLKDELDELRRQVGEGRSGQSRQPSERPQ